MNKLILLFLTVVFVAASTRVGAQSSKLTVVVHSVEGYGTYKAFALKAASALETVLNSPEFKSKVLNSTFIKTKGLTNEELYKRIMQAHEESGEGGQDGVVDLRVRTLRLTGDESDWTDDCQGSTIGVDGAGDGVTAICPNVLAYWAAKNDVADLAAHYAHEYMHILGFDHYNRLRGQSWRERTFVYMIGNIVAELIKNGVGGSS